MGDEWFTHVVMPYTDAANYTALELGAFITTGVTHQGRWIGALNVVSREQRTGKKMKSNCCVKWLRAPGR